MLSSLIRVDRAVTRVYQLALTNFTDPKLIASCAAFIEMLSRDSTLLRVDTQTAARLLLHQESLQANSSVSSREEESDEHRLAFKTKISGLRTGTGSVHLYLLFLSPSPSILSSSFSLLAASQLTQLYKTPDNMTLALGIAHKLEKATVHLIEASRIGRCVLKSGEEKEREKME